MATLDKLLRTALVLAAPILLIVVLSFFILIIIARFIPQINVFDLSMSFRNIAFFIALQIYAIYVVEYLMPEIAGTKSAVEVLKGFFHE
jgi:type III secretion protein T